METLRLRRIQQPSELERRFNPSTSSDQRNALCGMFKATMDVAESWIAKNGDEQQLAAFKEARADDYTRLNTTT